MNAFREEGAADVGAYQRREFGALPPPLWGRVGEGGDAVTHRRCPTQRPLPLTPPHKGEGKCTESAGGGKVEPAARAARSFAAIARAAMLACNDHNGFAVIAHGPHCDHRAD